MLGHRIEGRQVSQPPWRAKAWFYFYFDIGEGLKHIGAAIRVVESLWDRGEGKGFSGVRSDWNSPHWRLSQLVRWLVRNGAQKAWCLWR